jgi:rare lipoprotein A
VVAPVVHDAPAASGTIFVQAGAFSDHARAQVASRIGGSLSKLGNVWRVRVGPFGSQSAAASALAKVKSAGYSEARIQRAD